MCRQAGRLWVLEGNPHGLVYPGNRHHVLRSNLDTNKQTNKQTRLIIYNFMVENPLHYYNIHLLETSLKLVLYSVAKLKHQTPNTKQCNTTRHHHHTLRDAPVLISSREGPGRSTWPVSASRRGGWASRCLCCSWSVPRSSEVCCNRDDTARGEDVTIITETRLVEYNTITIHAGCTGN